MDAQRARGLGVDEDDLEGAEARTGVQPVAFPYRVCLPEVRQIGEEPLLIALAEHVHLTMAATAFFAGEIVTQGIL